jgi:hypothetical protein
MSSNRIASSSPDNPSVIAQAFDPAWALEHDTASGAIAIKEGTVVLDAGSALAMTLVAPTAGAPSAGGDDGKELTIITRTAQAHTVTTPANALNTNKHIATWTAAIGNAITFIAYNGVWYASLVSGVTIT